MKNKSYSGSTSKKHAKQEVNRMVKEVKQEIDSLSTATSFTNTDLTELFMAQLLERLGVPLGGNPSADLNEEPNQGGTQ